VDRKDLYRLTQALGAHFVASYPEPPAAIVRDLDHTDDPPHGQHEIAFYNHYYKNYYYLPLFTFEGLSGAYYDSIHSDDAASRVEEPTMPGPKPPAVPLSEEEHHALYTLCRARASPRCPTPRGTRTFSVGQWCQIIALVCMPPAVSGRPLSHWTPHELVDETRKRGIVETISERHVGCP
jgi:hypothetical protein